MKKGSTLIELIIYLGLSSMTLILAFNMLLPISKFYNKRKNQNIIENEMLNASLYIENLLKGRNFLEVKVYNDKIEIVEDKKSTVIYEDKNNLRVKFLNESRIDLLANNIEGFKPTKKGNLIYFKIISKKGYEVKRCLNLKVENQEAY